MTLKPVIELQEYSNCWLSIKDVTGTWSSSSNNTILYYDEDRSNAAGTPYSTKWSTSISIIILSKLDGVGVRITGIYFMPHDDSRTFSIKVPEDGYNVINYIVLPVTTIVPTSSAVAGNAKLGTTTTTISGSNVIVGYYESDLKKGIYQNGISITPDVLLTYDYSIPAGSPSGTTDESSIARGCKPYFSTCNLKECYIDIAKKLINSSSFSNCSNNKDANLSDLKYRRDLVWMTINVIKYLIDISPAIYDPEYKVTALYELPKYLEAQRILDKIMSCNGLCSKTINGNDCGCK